MIERADFPEAVDVNSDIVMDLIKYFESIKLRVDSFMVLRDGKVACECHWKPNTVDIPHDMYSLSKSIVAIAIGIAVDEGILSLDTKIYRTYFPEKLEKLKGKQREWADMVTIHHVIAMRMGKVTSIFDDKETTDWIDGLLDRPIKFEPGTDWKYISENAFLLSWILQKETGMTMTEFLTPRLFEPLEMNVPQWEKNQYGVEAGGWGLRISAEDLAKIALLFLGKGVYNGKRIFSEDWYNTCTFPFTKREEVYPIFTSETDYGYQIWIDHENNDTTYRFTGLYGQFLFAFPEYNAAVIVTASDNRDAEFIHNIYLHFPKAFIEPTKELSEDKKKAFAQYMNSRVIKPNFKNPADKRNTTKEKEISGHLIKLIPKSNLSTQGATTYFMWKKKIGHLNDIKFDFNSDGFAFSFKEKDTARAAINVGMNGEYVYNKVVLGDIELNIAAQAAWNKDGSLEMFLYTVGAPQTRRLTFRFNHKVVNISSKTDPGYADIAKFNIEFNMGMPVGHKIESALNTLVPVFNAFYGDPGTKGWML